MKEPKASELEEQLVTIFKLGMMDALGGKGKPSPIPAVKECQKNIKQLFLGLIEESVSPATPEMHRFILENKLIELVEDL